MGTETTGYNGADMERRLAELEAAVDRLISAVPMAGIPVDRPVPSPDDEDDEFEPSHKFQFWVTSNSEARQNQIEYLADNYAKLHGCRLARQRHTAVYADSMILYVPVEDYDLATAEAADLARVIQLAAPFAGISWRPAQ